MDESVLMCLMRALDRFTEAYVERTEAERERLAFERERHVAARESAEARLSFAREKEDRLARKRK